MKFEELQDAGLPTPADGPLRRTTSGRGWDSPTALGDGQEAVRASRRIPHLVLPAFRCAAWTAQMRHERRPSPRGIPTHRAPTPTSRPTAFSNWAMRAVPTIIAGVNSRDQITHRVPRRPLARGWAVQPATSPRTSRTRGCMTGISPSRKKSWPTPWRGSPTWATTAAHLEQFYRYNEQMPTYIWYATTRQPTAHRRVLQRGAPAVRPDGLRNRRGVSQERAGPTTTACSSSWSGATARASASSCST